MMQSFPNDDFLRYVAAIHESGHALASLALQKPVHAIAVNESGGGGNFYPSPTAEQPKRQPRSFSEIFQGIRLEPDDPFVLGCLVVDYAGGATQLMMRNCGTLQGCDTDRANAERMIAAVCSNEAERRALRRKAIDQATDIVSEYWPQIQAIGRRLFHLHRLEKPEIVSVLRRSAAGRRLLGEMDPPEPLPVMTREIAFSEVLQKYALLLSDGRCKFFGTREEACNEPDEAIRYREARFV